MNAIYDRLPARFEPEVRFEVPTAPFRETGETELERLKNTLLRELLAANPDVQFNAPLRRAANEAAALAWLTPYPLLVLPELLAEKAKFATKQASRQSRVRIRSRAFLVEEAA